MDHALGFLDWGRWVADCPRCTYAVAVYAEEERATEARCPNGHPFTVVMPAPAEERRIMAAVADRPAAAQSWYPAEHERARAAGLPVGQSVADLADETRAGRDAEADEREHRREQLIAMGLDVDADGTVRGRL